jgi:hypothetical protein
MTRVTDRFAFTAAGIPALLAEMQADGGRVEIRTTPDGSRGGKPAVVEGYVWRLGVAMGVPCVVVGANSSEAAGLVAPVTVPLPAIWNVAAQTSAHAAELIRQKRSTVTGYRLVGGDTGVDLKRWGLTPGDCIDGKTEGGYVRRCSDHGKDMDCPVHGVASPSNPEALAKAIERQQYRSQRPEMRYNRAGRGQG